MNLNTLLRQRIAQTGGLRRFARAWNIDPGYLCRVVSGRQSAGPQILNALGIRREIAYRRK